MSSRRGIPKINRVDSNIDRTMVISIGIIIMLTNEMILLSTSNKKPVLSWNRWKHKIGNEILPISEKMLETGPTCTNFFERMNIK